MSGEEVRRRWRTLTPEQTATAGELLERAMEFLDRFGDLSIGEAIELAAEAMERRAMAFRSAEAQRKAAAIGDNGRQSATRSEKTMADLPQLPQSEVPRDVREVSVQLAPTEQPVEVVLAHRGTHCRRGHLYSPENTAFDTDGARRCRTCKRAWALQRLADPKVREVKRRYDRRRGRRIAAEKRAAALQQGGA